LLRIAESLDRSHSGYIQSARLKALDKQRAALRLSASHDCQLELWSVENQKDDFERAFDHELTIEMAKKIAS
jgi:exopolyphosphatase / guanosine-5'-triphosphate,3'-diphosphate pyrophosphatase